MSVVAGHQVSMTGDGSEVLLAVHGLGGDRHQPLALLSDEVFRRYRTVAIDLPAHGETELPGIEGALDFARMAESVESVLSELGVTSVIALGISMGAGVCLRVAANRVIEVRSLALVRPAWFTEPNPPNLEAFPAIAELLSSHDDAAVAEQIFRADPRYQRIREVSPAAAEVLLGQFGLPDAARRSARLRDLPADRPVSDGELAEIAARHVPSLVIASGLDPVHPVAIARRLASALNAEYVEAPPRYGSPDEHAQVVAGVLTEFLCGPEPGRISIAPGPARTG